MSSYGDTPNPQISSRDDSTGNVRYDGGHRQQDRRGPGLQTPLYEGNEGSGIQGGRQGQGWQGDRQWDLSPSDNYGDPGSQDDNVGGGTYGTGRNLGGATTQNEQTADDSTGGPGGPGGKPSLVQRLKGGAQEAAGKATRNEGLVERGQQEKSER